MKSGLIESDVFTYRIQENRQNRCYIGIGCLNESDSDTLLFT